VGAPKDTPLLPGHGEEEEPEGVRAQASVRHARSGSQGSTLPGRPRRAPGREERCREV